MKAQPPECSAAQSNVLWPHPCKPRHLGHDVCAVKSLNQPPCAHTSRRRICPCLPTASLTLLHKPVWTPGLSWVPWLLSTAAGSQTSRSTVTYGLGSHGTSSHRPPGHCVEQAWGNASPQDPQTAGPDHGPTARASQESLSSRGDAESLALPTRPPRPCAQSLPAPASCGNRATRCPRKAGLCLLTGSANTTLYTPQRRENLGVHLSPRCPQVYTPGERP